MIWAWVVITSLSADCPAAVQAFQYWWTAGAYRWALNGLTWAAISAWFTWVLLDSRLTTTEMPMLLPMLRIRLNRPVASVRHSGGSVENVTVLSGTKIRPKARPWTKPVRTISHRDTSGV